MVLHFSPNACSVVSAISQGYLLISGTPKCQGFLEKAKSTCEGVANPDNPLRRSELETSESPVLGSIVDFVVPFQERSKITTDKAKLIVRGSSEAPGDYLHGSTKEPLRLPLSIVLGEICCLGGELQKARLEKRL